MENRFFSPTTRRLYYWCCQIREYQTREKVKGRSQRWRRRKRWCWSSWNFVGKWTPFTNHTLLNLDKDPYIGLFSLGTQEGEQPPPNFILWHESQCLHCTLTVTSCGCFQRAHSLSCMFIIRLMAKWSAVTFAMHSGTNNHLNLCRICSFVSTQEGHRLISINQLQKLLISSLCTPVHRIRPLRHDREDQREEKWGKRGKCRGQMKPKSRFLVSTWPTVYGRREMLRMT